MVKLSRWRDLNIILTTGLSIKKFETFFSRKVSDPRIPLLIMLIFYAIVLMRNPAFGKGIQHLMLIFSVVTLSDFLLNLVFAKKKFLSLSAMTSSVGVVLLVYTPEWQYFVIIALMISLPKYFIKFKNLHIFNPNNFGIVFALVFLSSNVTTTVGKWNFDLTMIIIMVLFGSAISYYAGRIMVSYTYILAFIFFSFMRSIFLNIPFDYVILPLLGPTFYLFTFYHITDPVTSPRNRWGMCLFAVLIAFIENIIRANEFLYAPFFAYFIVLSIQPFFQGIFQRNYNRGLEKTTA